MPFERIHLVGTNSTARVLVARNVVYSVFELERTRVTAICVPMQRPPKIRTKPFEEKETRLRIEEGILEIWSMLWNGSTWIEEGIWSMLWYGSKSELIVSATSNSRLRHIAKFDPTF